MTIRISLSFLLVAALLSASIAPTHGASAQSVQSTPTPAPTASTFRLLFLTPAPKESSEPSVIPYCIVGDVSLASDPCSNRQRIIFVIGLAGDAATKARLVGSLTDQLDGYNLNGRLIAEPTWTPDDFMNQCKADRKLKNLSVSEGAFVIASVGVASGVEDAFSRWNTKQEAGVNVLYAECYLEQRAHEPYAYIWSSHTQTGKAWKHQANTSRYISMVTGLLSAIGIVLSVLPTTTTKMTTKTTFPPPTPPAPSTGSISEVDSERDSQGASFSSLATTLLAQAASNSNVTPVIPPDDTQAWNAIEGAVYNVVSEMNCSAQTPSPSSTPSASPSSNTVNFTPRATPSPNSDVADFADKPQIRLTGKAPFCK